MKKLGAELKRHALTAISYMLPLVVASGLLIAIGNLMGGENVTELSKMTLPSALTTLGVMGMGLLPSFIAGYIAYSIADRPGIAPGFLMGQIASFLGAGFLGGMVGGYLVGYIALFIKNNLKVPKWAEALMPMMIVPTLSAIIAGLIMFFVVGTPITMATKALTNFITGLDQSSKAVYGFIIGALGCIDFGGPISKVPNLICDGLLLEGITGPEAIKVLAAMVPPLGITFSLVLSKLLKKNIYTAQEKENIKVSLKIGNDNEIVTAGKYEKSAKDTSKKPAADKRKKSQPAEQEKDKTIVAEIAEAKQQPEEKITQKPVQNNNQKAQNLFKMKRQGLRLIVVFRKILKNKHQITQVVHHKIMLPTQILSEKLHIIMVILHTMVIMTVQRLL